MREETECTVYEVNLENEYGGTSPGVRVECEYCNATQESFGRSDRSVRRCFAMLAEACGEDRFYIEGERVTSD